MIGYPHIRLEAISQIFCGNTGRSPEGTGKNRPASRTDRTGLYPGYLHHRSWLNAPGESASVCTLPFRLALTCTVDDLHETKAGLVGGELAAVSEPLARRYQSRVSVLVGKSALSKITSECFVIG